MDQQQVKFEQLRLGQESRHLVNSKNRLTQLKKEQKFLYDTFKIDNFYNDGKFDVGILKHKLGKVKTKQRSNNPEQRYKQDNRKFNKDSQTIMLLKKHLGKNYRCYQFHQPKKNNFSTINTYNIKEAYKQPPTYQSCHHISTDRKFRRDGANNSLSRITHKFSGKKSFVGAQHSLDKYDSHMEPHDQFCYNDSQSNSKIHNIGGHKFLCSKRKLLKSQTSNRSQSYSSRLQCMSTFKKNLTKIKIKDTEELDEFHNSVTNLWNLYQKLSQIVKIVSKSLNQVFNNPYTFESLMKVLCEYKSMVCSSRFEFLVNIVESCLDHGHSKTLILSRLYQNLSIICIILEITENRRNNTSFQTSHLVNFVGIASNNLLLLLRIISLISILDKDMAISDEAMRIFKIISSYQLSSFKEEITSIKDAVIRIQHNNESISIVHTKLGHKMTSKQYHMSCIGNFMREVLIQKLKIWIQMSGDKNNPEKQQVKKNVKPFYQYSYFLFQYLAYYLHHEKILGYFPKEIQTAPAPYLPIKRQFTVIINPLAIFLHERNDKYYIRAYTDKFIKELKKKCNVIFWNSLMPQEVDHLYDLIDQNCNNFKKKVSNYSKFGIVQHNYNESQEQNFERLYEHHCIFQEDDLQQGRLIKDVSRIGCKKGKYIIFDSNVEQYLEQQHNNVILLPWRGEPKNSKLLIMLNLIMPLLREGVDLSKQIKEIIKKIEPVNRGEKGRRKKNNQ